MVKEGSAFRSKFPTTWEAELSKIVSTNKTLKCASCGNLGFKYKSSLDELLTEVEYLVKNFDVTANGKGAKKFWDKVRGLNADGTVMNNISLPIMDELAQTLTFIKKTGLNDGNITSLGGSIGITTKFTDVLVTFENGVKKYKELKSYMQGAEGLDDGLDVVSGLNANALKNRTAFTSQFIDGYFNSIKNLDELEYIFEARKLGANGEAFIKAQFKDFMITKKAEIWGKMNNELKANLLIDDVSDFTTFKIDEIVNAIVKIY